jgi:hypothetical protein
MVLAAFIIGFKPDVEDSDRQSHPLHARSGLDPVDPSHLQPCFDAAIDMLRQRGGLKSFERLGGRILVALDGTEYFCPQKLSCPNCLTRRRNNDKAESYHTLLAATIAAPGHASVVPLMPPLRRMDMRNASAWRPNAGWRCMARG